MTARATHAAALGLCVTLAAAPLVPLYLAASSERPPHRVFGGFEPATVADAVVDLHYYAGFIEDARRDLSPLFRNRATSEPQDGRFLSLSLWALGIFGRLTDMGAPALWTLFRSLAALFFFASVWQLLSAWFREPNRRLVCFTLVALGGGLGWVAALAGAGEESLADLRRGGMIGYSTFGQLYHPQLLVAYGLFAQALRSFLAGRTWRAVVWALFVFGAHPPSAPVLYAALLSAPLGALLRLAPRDAWAHVKAAWPLFIPPLLAVAYVIWAHQDPVYRGFGETYARFADVPSLREPVWSFLVGYGCALPLAVVGALRPPADTGTPRAAIDALVGWTAIAAAASVNPFFFTWKLQFALHLPLCVLAVRALDRFGARARIATAALLSLSLPSSLFLYGGHVSRAGADERLYLAEEDNDAMKALGGLRSGTVLSRYRSGHEILWRTHHTVFFAHYSGTLRPRDKEQAVRRFFDPAVSPGDKRSFLAAERIRHVYEGPREREWGWVDPRLGLRVTYRNASVTLYEVTDAPPAPERTGDSPGGRAPDLPPPPARAR